MIRAAFRLIYDTETIEHMVAIDEKHHSLIRETNKEQLTFEPDKETKNRKPLLRPTTIGADWELRFGEQNMFRVLYRPDRSLMEVYILAIGIKIQNKLYVGGKEFKS